MTAQTLRKKKNLRSLRPQGEQRMRQEMKSQRQPADMTMYYYTQQVK